MYLNFVKKVNLRLKILTKIKQKLKGQEETLGDHGYIHDLDCGAMIMGISIYIHVHQIEYVKHVHFQSISYFSINFRTKWTNVFSN